MEEIKKIIAKAAYGQGVNLFSKDVHINTIERKRPAEVLGSVITNAEILSCAFEGNTENGKAVRVKGKFDVHLWYSLDGDTKVTKTSKKFSEIVTVYGEAAEKYHHEEVRAWISKAPTCSGTSVADEPEGSAVIAKVEYVLGAEVFGQTTLNVKAIYPADVSEEPDEIPVENGEIPDEYEDD